MLHSRFCKLCSTTFEWALVGVTTGSLFGLMVCFGMIYGVIILYRFDIFLNFKLYYLCFRIQHGTYCLWLGFWCSCLFIAYLVNKLKHKYYNCNYAIIIILQSIAVNGITFGRMWIVGCFWFCCIVVRHRFLLHHLAWMNYRWQHYIRLILVYHYIVLFFNIVQLV